MLGLTVPPITANRVICANGVFETADGISSTWDPKTNGLTGEFLPLHVKFPVYVRFAWEDFVFLFSGVQQVFQTSNESGYRLVRRPLGRVRRHRCTVSLPQNIAILFIEADNINLEGKPSVADYLARIYATKSRDVINGSIFHW